MAMTADWASSLLSALQAPGFRGTVEGYRNGATSAPGGVSRRLIGRRQDRPPHQRARCRTMVTGMPRAAQLNPERLWSYALRLLGQRAYSAGELRAKLRLRADSVGAVEQVMTKLADYGL